MVAKNSVMGAATVIVKICRCCHEYCYPFTAEIVKLVFVAKLRCGVSKVPAGVMVKLSRRKGVVFLQHKQEFYDATEVMYIELLRISVNKQEHKRVLHILVLGPKYLTMLHWVILTKTGIYVHLLWLEYKLCYFCLWSMRNTSSATLLMLNLGDKVLQYSFMVIWICTHLEVMRTLSKEEYIIILQSKCGSMKTSTDAREQSDMTMILVRILRGNIGFLSLNTLATVCHWFYTG